MKKMILVGGCVVMLSVGGCTSVRNFLADPATGVAATNALKFTTVIVCGLSTASAGAQSVETQPVPAGSAALVDARGEAITVAVYAASTVACKLLGGIALSTATVPATTAIAQ